MLQYVKPCKVILYWSFFFCKQLYCFKQLFLSNNNNNNNMRVTVIPIVIGAFGIVLKGLEKRKKWKLEEESRPSKLQHCWDRPEYWEEPWGFEETCCHSAPSGRPSANRWCEKLVRSYIITLLGAKLCNKNLVKGINTWAVQLVRYSESFVK